MTGQETPLLILVQHREVRPGTVETTVVGTQHAAAQAVDGADAHPGEVSRAPGGGGQGDETLLQFPRRGLGVGSQHQIFRFGQPAEQDVGSRSATAKVLPVPGPAMPNVGPSRWPISSSCPWSRRGCSRSMAGATPAWSFMFMLVLT